MISNGTGRRIALVVGVNTAPQSFKPPLKRAVTDAQEIAEVLQQPFCGFELFGGSPLLERQATTWAIRDSFQQLVIECNVEDSLLFYFSGHGIPMHVEGGRREVYLGTSDFNVNKAEIDETYFIAFKLLREMLYEKCCAGRVLLMLDCCSAGDWGGMGPDPYLDELRERINYYFSTSGDSTRVATHGLRQVLAGTGPGYTRLDSASDGEGGLTWTSLILPVLRGEIENIMYSDEEGITALALSTYLERERRLLLPFGIRSSLSGDTTSEAFPLAYHKHRIPKPETVLPKARNPLFRERNGEFEQIKRYLFHSRQPARIGLIGMPGIGNATFASIWYLTPTLC